MINTKLKKTKVYGWSRSDFTISQYYKTSSIDEVNSIFELAKKNNKKISLRSGGRSYGDNTLNKDNRFIDVVNLKLNEVITKLLFVLDITQFIFITFFLFGNLSK